MYILQSLYIQLIDLIFVSKVPDLHTLQYQLTSNNQGKWNIDVFNPCDGFTKLGTINNETVTCNNVVDVNVCKAWTPTHYYWNGDDSNWAITIFERLNCTGNYYTFIEEGLYNTSSSPALSYSVNLTDN